MTELKLKAIIIKVLGITESEFSEDKDFIDDYAADSLDLTELIMEIEGIFGIAIPDEDVDKLRTYNNVLGYVKSKVA